MFENCCSGTVIPPVDCRRHGSWLLVESLYPTKNSRKPRSWWCMLAYIRAICLCSFTPILMLSLYSLLRFMCLQSLPFSHVLHLGLHSDAVEVNCFLELSLSWKFDSRSSAREKFLLYETGRDRVHNSPILRIILTFSMIHSYALYPSREVYCCFKRTPIIYHHLL
jgi:hypothetical protein